MYVAWVHMHVCVSAYGGLRLILRIFLNYSSTLFIEEGSLNQNQGSSASLLQDDLSHCLLRLELQASHHTYYVIYVDSGD